jgi:hypothetical protein
LFAVYEVFSCPLVWTFFVIAGNSSNMVLSATSKDFEPMESPEFVVCCFCNRPTKAVATNLFRARYAHPECYLKDVRARNKKEVEVPAQARYLAHVKVRAILWTLTMAYTGFLLSGQGLRTFNSLSITEGCLGAVTGFLLALMFTLRERRRRRPALIAYPFVEMLPNWGIPSERRSDRDIQD